MATQSNSPFGLQGKRVVITGAGGGIGQVLISTFHSAGATIIACDSNQELLDRLPADSVAERHLFDMTDRESIKKAGAAIEAPDILVNNAGWTRADVFAQVDDSTVDVELQLNLTGVIDFTRALLPKMAQAAGGGSIVFISSANALQHYGNPIYAVAKAGQVAFARAIALEHGESGIRANTVCPGSVRTVAWEHRIATNPKVFQEVLKHYPLRRIVTPQEVANSVMFLASPLASGITGATLSVDAGLTAGNRQFIDEVISASI